jgi:hypothetical protein
MEVRILCYHRHCGFKSRNLFPKTPMPRSVVEAAHDYPKGSWRPRNSTPATSKQDTTSTGGTLNLKAGPSVTEPQAHFDPNVKTPVIHQGPETHNGCTCEGCLKRALKHIAKLSSKNGRLCWGHFEPKPSTVQAGQLWQRLHADGDSASRALIFEVHEDTAHYYLVEGGVKWSTAVTALHLQSRWQYHGTIAEFRPPVSAQLDKALLDRALHAINDLVADDGARPWGANRTKPKTVEVGQLYCRYWTTGNEERVLVVVAAHGSKTARIKSRGTNCTIEHTVPFESILSTTLEYSFHGTIDEFKPPPTGDPLTIEAQDTFGHKDGIFGSQPQNTEVRNPTIYQQTETAGVAEDLTAYDQDAQTPWPPKMRLGQVWWNAEDRTLWRVSTEPIEQCALQCVSPGSEALAPRIFSAYHTPPPPTARKPANKMVTIGQVWTRILQRTRHVVNGFDLPDNVTFHPPIEEHDAPVTIQELLEDCTWSLDYDPPQPESP